MRRLPLILAACQLALGQDLSIFQSGISNDSIQAIYQGDRGYADASRPFNLRYASVSPAAIVYPNSADDVSSILQAAMAANISAQAKSGGHSYATLAERNDSITINLRNMRAINVDSSSGIASIESGNHLGDVALALWEQGQRALPHGSCPWVGMGGHVSLGGWGFSSRQWGMTLDNLIALDVVLANGLQVTASNESNTELFYALRGAGSSYGIVTTFHFQTLAAPTSAIIYTYRWNLDIDAATEALVNFQAFCNSGIPKEIGLEINLGKGSSNGTVSFEFHGAFYGDADAYNSTVAPYLSVMPEDITSQSIQGGNWLDSVNVLAGNQKINTTGQADYSDTFYAKSLMTPESQTWSNASIRAYVTYMATQGHSTQLNWFCQVECYGGSNSAVNAVPTDQTSFVHRDKLFNIQFYASSQSYGPPYPENGISFLNDMVDTITGNEDPSWPYGAYVNYVDSNLTDSQWQSLYYPGIYAHLSALKAQYDPTNVFRFFTAIQADNATTNASTANVVQTISAALRTQTSYISALAGLLSVLYVVHMLL